MARTKTTLLVDEGLLRRIRVKAARTGRSQSDVFEEALRQGLDPIERIRIKASLNERDAHTASGEALREVRKAKRGPARKKAAD